MSHWHLTHSKVSSQPGKHSKLRDVRGKLTHQILSLTLTIHHTSHHTPRDQAERKWDGLLSRSIALRVSYGSVAPPRLPIAFVWLLSNRLRTLRMQPQGTFAGAFPPHTWTPPKWDTGFVRYRLNAADFLWRACRIGP
jgi:hypothetical protein